MPIRTRTSEDTDVVIDITDAASVDAGMEETRPDVVVLLAAISDIDLCERRAGDGYSCQYARSECMLRMPVLVKDARLLFTSTGAVFDGLKHGYREEDTPTPLSVYGKTKAQAEGVIQQLSPIGGDGSRVVGVWAGVESRARIRCWIICQGAGSRRRVSICFGIGISQSD